MIEYRSGTVVEQIGVWGNTQELLVRLEDGSEHKAIHYTDVNSPVRPGDRVTLNTTAVSLELGSGGYHFVHDVRGTTLFSTEMKDNDSIAQGHIMKLRYTSMQRKVFAAEEAASPHHGLFREDRTLDGMPVLIGELHSMLPAAAAWINWKRQTIPSCRPIRCAYIMTDGGALPLAYSKHVHQLMELGWIEGTVTYGHAYGGNVETVNKFTALLAARHILKCDIAIAIMGPGIVGTGTTLGHSGMEVGELVHAVRMLGGQPIVIPRVSFSDSRERHRGLSHHLLTLLSRYTLVAASLPFSADLPHEQMAFLHDQLNESRLASNHNIHFMEGITPDQVEQSLHRYPIEVCTMGRSFSDDPFFFISISCAAELALSFVLSPAVHG